jgi:DNA-binding response OmpR family regulator
MDRSNENDKKYSKDSTRRTIEYLDEGAAQCMERPVNALVLSANIRAIERNKARKLPQIKFQMGSLDIDLEKQTLKRNGSPIWLSQRDQELFDILAKNPGRVISPEEIAAKILSEQDQDNYPLIRTYISRLRRKIEADSRRPEYLHTIQDRGYVFDFSLLKDKKPAKKRSQKKVKREAKTVVNSQKLEGRWYGEFAFPDDFVEWEYEYNKKDLIVDTKKEEATREKTNAPLTELDKKVLYFFSKHSGRIIPLTEIQESVGFMLGDNITVEETDSLALQLQKKVNPHDRKSSRTPKILKNYPGFGFSFELFPKAVKK